MATLPWWHRAPVSKALALGTLGSTLVVLSQGHATAEALSLDAWRVLGSSEVWRLVTCHLPFSGLSELVFGLSFLYQFRLYERMLGSAKFGAFLIIVASVASSLETFIVGSISSVPLTVAPGPFAIIFALLALQHEITPVTKPAMLGVLGVNFSEKAVPMCLSLPLLFSQGFASILPSSVGFFTGWLYSQDFLGMQQFRLPRLIQDCLSFLFSRLLHERHALARPPPAAWPSWRRPGDAVPGQAAPANHAQAPPPQASEEDILSLMQMGFERDDVVRALQDSGNNVQVAADRLLSPSYRG
uniref:UBA domain-containing protein n=1 Tax=Rhizochromulina marina TaxID=1034831 RepID=A0A7S2WHG0_9STRA|mmetsp:Transcript_24755/g.72597  ORF Transcript_24755/g.72597 Transcript_24755/m.72597 type:complete len:300 (+) Transcript_24755:192-1091(+)